MDLRTAFIRKKQRHTTLNLRNGYEKDTRCGVYEMRLRTATLFVLLSLGLLASCHPSKHHEKQDGDTSSSLQNKAQATPPEAQDVRSKWPQLGKMIDNIVKQQSRTIFSISPSQEYMAYRSVDDYTFRFCVANLKTKTDQTLFEDRKVFTGARFSPDSRYLAVFKDKTGDEQYQLLVFDMKRGGALIFASPNLVKLTRFSWSQQSTLLVYFPVLNDERVISLIDLSTQKESFITAVPEPPKEIAVRADNSVLRWIGEKQGLYTYDLASRSLEPFPLARTLVPVNVYSFPDQKGDVLQANNTRTGETVFFTLLKNGALRPFKKNILKGAMELLPFSQEHFAFTKQQHLSVQLWIWSHGKTLALKTPISGGIATPIVWSSDGTQLFFTWENHKTAPAIYMASLNSPAPLVTMIAHPLFTPAHYGTTFQGIRVGSINGLPVYAANFAPACTSKPRGAFIYLHGKNPSVTRDKWYPFVSALNSLGWVVLGLNMSGSIFYGPAYEKRGFSTLLSDYRKELLVARNYLTRRYSLPPKRIALIGFSFGMRIALHSVLTSHDEYLGVMDLNGPPGSYDSANPALLKTSWIHIFIGEKDYALRDKPKIVRAFIRAARDNAAPNLDLSSTSLKRENHMLFFPQSWQIIFERIVTTLAKDNLIDMTCFREDT